MSLPAHAFTLRQLQYAVAIADALSFRKAADRCQVSQPSLSAQIALLERALGAKLFERSRRRVMIAPTALPLIDRARALLRDADDLEAAARRASDPLCGTLRIGIIPTISPYMLPAITPVLRKAFPKLRCFWIEQGTPTLRRLLEAGELDAALLALEADLGDIAWEVIGKDPFLLAVPPGHDLAAKRGPVAAGDLRGTNVLLLDDPHCLRHQALEFCSRARAHEMEFRATSIATLVQMVASGAGVTLLPELAADHEAKRAGLTLRRFAKPEPFRTIALVWRRNAALADALKQVSTVIRKAVD